MNDVFGSGNWLDYRFQTTPVTSIFNAANSFVFLEGSDNTANDLEAFLTTNQTAVETYVSNGGSLFINSAPNVGNGMSYLFGDVSLVYPSFTGATLAYPVNPAHPIFNGPFNPANGNFTGNYFSHGHITGTNVSALIVNGANNTVLGEKYFGSGRVLFGAMTTDNWQTPDPQANNMRRNILAYGASYQAPTVPEPATLSLLFVGLVGLFFLRRKK